MKKIYFLLLLISVGLNVFGQSGIKWATNGNSVLTTDFLGTINNQNLIFKTNNIQRAQITSSGFLQLNNLTGTGNRLLQTDAGGNIIPFPMGASNQVLLGNGTWATIPSFFWQQSGSNIFYNGGNVGIGTNSPFVALDVVGDARISNNLYVGGGIIITEKVNANTEVVTSSVKADSIATDSTKGFYGTSKFNGSVKLQSKLTVDGTTTINGPLKLLGGMNFIVAPPVSINPCIEMLGLSSDGTLVQMDAAADLSFDPSTSPCPEPPIIPFTWQTWGNHVNNDVRWIGTIENFDFRIKTNSTLRMIVKKDGKVGIGTATPTEIFEVIGNAKINGNSKVTGNSVVDGAMGIGTDLADPSNAPYKLCVNGFVRAKKVVVETGWSDFVFDKNYKLFSLEEVESYINKNHHLPFIPSAKEIETNGGDLGELAKLQMQKIEELTLYLIEQNKKLKQLEEELRKMQEKK